MDMWMPHELNDQQKMRRFEVSSALLLRNKNEPFLDRIVTYNEKWIMYNNRRRSAQWLDKDETPKQFPEPDPNGRKVMITVWWISKGVKHYDLAKLSWQTVTVRRSTK